MKNKQEKVKGDVPKKDKGIRLLSMLDTEYERGNIAIMGIEGIMVMPMKQFLKQPIEGMLYDLNRDMATVRTWIRAGNPKWINDYAVCKVIRELKRQIEELNSIKS